MHCSASCPIICPLIYHCVERGDRILARSIIGDANSKALLDAALFLCLKPFAISQRRDCPVLVALKSLFIVFFLSIVINIKACHKER